MANGAWIDADALSAAGFLPLIYITYAGAAERSFEGIDIALAKGGCENIGYMRAEELEFLTDEGMMREWDSMELLKRWDQQSRKGGGGSGCGAKSRESAEYGRGRYNECYGT